MTPTSFDTDALRGASLSHALPTLLRNKLSIDSATCALIHLSRIFGGLCTVGASDCTVACALCGVAVLSSIKIRPHPIVARALLNSHPMMRARSRVKAQENTAFVFSPPLLGANTHGASPCPPPSAPSTIVTTIIINHQTPPPPPPPHHHPRLPTKLYGLAHRGRRKPRLQQQRRRQLCCCCRRRSIARSTFTAPVDVVRV